VEIPYSLLQQFGHLQQSSIWICDATLEKMIALEHLIMQVAIMEGI
jgi:hypothetical protein